MTQPDMPFRDEDFIDSCKPHIVNERWADVVKVIANEKIRGWMRCNSAMSEQHLPYHRDGSWHCDHCGLPLIVIAVAKD